MKTLSLLLGLFSFGVAEAQLGISPTQTSDLSCKLMSPIARAKDGGSVYGCVSKQVLFALEMKGITIDKAKAISEGSSINLNLHCTLALPTGVFAFGGITPGYTNNQNFFYLPKAFGRCFVTGDAVLLKNIKFEKNAMIAIQPVGALNSPQVAQ